MEKVRPWCGRPSDRGRLKYATERPQKEFDKVFLGSQQYSCPSNTFAISVASFLH